MKGLHHKIRWVFGPLKADGTALAGEYALNHTTLLEYEGMAMTQCEFNVHGLAAARACTSLTVLPSIHAKASIGDPIAKHFSGHGLSKDMSHYDAMMALAKYHPGFEPAE